MTEKLHRRGFAKAGAAAALAAAIPRDSRAAVPKCDPTAGACGAGRELQGRPYQLMCIVCRMGEGRTDDLGNPRLTEILRAVRKDRKTPLTLCCNVDTVFHYQNPGHADDTPEGELFNAKRDLDILHMMGMVPGDRRPAIDVFERLLATVPSTRGICGYDKVTAEQWRGCVKAQSGHYEKGHKMGIKAILPPPSADELAQRKKTSAAAIYRAKTLRLRPHHLMCMSCFAGDKPDLAPIDKDNLFEPIDVIRKNPDTPVTLIAGCCMVCLSCSRYEPESNFCLGGKSMAVRDQKKDLDVLQKLGLKYGDTLPARQLFELLYERIPSTRDVCGYGDGQERGYEWRICGGPEGNKNYEKARATKLGL